MTQVPIGEAQGRLPELIATLGPGESIQVTEDDRPVARLVREVPASRRPGVPGSAVGLLTVVADDDAHLADFGDYMP